MTELLLTQFPVDWSRGPIQPRCSVPPWVKDNWRARVATGTHRHYLPHTCTVFPHSWYQYTPGACGWHEPAKGGGGWGNGEGPRSARLRGCHSLPTPARRRPHPNAAKSLYRVVGEVVVKQPLRSGTEMSGLFLSQRPRRAAQLTLVTAGRPPPHWVQPTDTASTSVPAAGLARSHSPRGYPSNPEP